MSGRALGTSGRPRRRAGPLPPAREVKGRKGGSPHSLGQRSDAATRHVEEGAGAGTCAQGSFDATQQVVGLEDEQHLARHVAEELADLGEVVRRVVADL